MIRVISCYQVTDGERKITRDKFAKRSEAFINIVYVVKVLKLSNIKNIHENTNKHHVVETTLYVCQYMMICFAQNGHVT